jgi:uncharacterized repeat protein (TIGR03803 family)
MHAVLAAIAVVFASTVVAQAARPGALLATFHGAPGPGNPSGPVLRNAQGVLYGTSESGGSSNFGTVYSLAPPAAGQLGWALSVLHEFSYANGDGIQPTGGVVADTAGNLYGTTTGGGANAPGIVYELSPPAAGQTQWTETVLSAIGGTPSSGVIIGIDGALYGTTQQGGQFNLGTVFRLAPPAAGQTGWTTAVLHSFAGGTDGNDPYGALVSDARGNLYGTAITGGAANQGIVYELTPPVGQGAWSATVLHNFTGRPADGSIPESALVIDATGALIGTTSQGGPTGNAGVVFRLAPPAAGQTAWTESLLFTFNGKNGIGDLAGLSMDRAGNLYGTTDQSRALLYELSPPPAGQTTWVQAILYANANAKFGSYPASTVAIDPAGNLYGTSGEGGTGGGCPQSGGCGNEFEFYHSN